MKNHSFSPLFQTLLLCSIFLLTTCTGDKKQNKQNISGKQDILQVLGALVIVKSRERQI